MAVASWRRYECTWVFVLVRTSLVRDRWVVRLALQHNEVVKTPLSMAAKLGLCAALAVLSAAQNLLIQGSRSDGVRGPRAGCFLATTSTTTSTTAASSLLLLPQTAAVAAVAVVRERSWW